MVTAFITGATSGIGKAIARRLAKEKFALILTGRRSDRLEVLKKEIEHDYGAKVHTLCFDVQDYNQVASAVNSLPDEWKTVDVLVNNAGLSVGLEPIHTAEINDWERMIDTNIKGLLYVTRVISPGMVARKSGHIINLGSIAGRTVYPNGVVYCATKHAVKAINEGMRMDFLPYGIRVTEVGPGATETEFSLVRFKGDQQRADKVYEGFSPLVAEDIAEAVYFAVSQPPHVNIQDVLIMPTAQVNPVMIHRTT
jgi:NADP-dependent 3-hydroxy acid dehydrogenase YdfG